MQTTSDSSRGSTWLAASGVFIAGVTGVPIAAAANLGRTGVSSDSEFPFVGVNGLGRSSLEFVESSLSNAGSLMAVVVALPLFETLASAGSSRVASESAVGLGSACG